MKLRVQFISFFVLIAFFVLCAGIVNLMMARDANQRFDRILKQTAPSLIALGQIKSISLRMVSDAYNSTVFQPVVMGSSKKAELAESLKEKIDDFQKEQLVLKKWIDDYSELVSDREGHNLVVILRELETHLEEVGTTLEYMMEEGSRESDIQDLQEVIEVTDGWLLEVVDDAIEKELKKLRYEDEISRSKASQSFSFTVFFILFAVFLSIVSGILLARLIASPLEKIKESTELIGKGDFDVHIDLNRKDEIGDLAHAFNRMAVNLKEVTASKESLDLEIKHRLQIEKDLRLSRDEAEKIGRQRLRFLSRISPGIRRPLNALLGFIPFIKRSELTPIQREYIQILERSESAFRYLIDMLDFMKLESGELFIENITFNLAHLCADIYEYFREEIDGTQCSLEFKVSSQLPVYVCGDPTRIRQLLIHLLSNSFLRAKTKVVFEVDSYCDDTGKQFVNFSITDDGDNTEIKSEVLFNEFLSLNRSFTRGFSDEGLGIAFAKGLVTSMNGTLLIGPDETDEKGFFIELPMPNGSSEEYAAVPVSKFSLEGKRVAVIVSDKTMQEGIADICSSLNMDIRLYSELSEAESDLLNAETAAYDLIVFDFFVSEINDYALIKKIRSTDVYADVKIIALQTQSAPGDARLAQNAGFSGFLQFGDVWDDLIPMICVLFAEGKKHEQIITKHMVRELFLKDMTIVVVDDDPVNLKLMNVLVQSIGSQAVLFDNGDDALDYLRSGSKADLVFLDIQMPGKSGLDVVRELRRDVKSDISVVAMSSHDLKSELEMFINEGFNDFLLKPIDIQNMKNKLSTVVHKVR